MPLRDLEKIQVCICKSRPFAHALANKKKSEFPPKNKIQKKVRPKSAIAQNS